MFAQEIENKLSYMEDTISSLSSSMQGFKKSDLSLALCTKVEEMMKEYHKASHHRSSDFKSTIGNFIHQKLENDMINDHIKEFKDDLRMFEEKYNEISELFCMCKIQVDDMVKKYNSSVDNIFESIGAERKKLDDSLESYRMVCLLPLDDDDMQMISEAERDIKR
ncbi:hypothetical protein BEWA_028160 [Theileria equi strain WA]|uniref:Inhibitor of growth protein N-terminal histone-binding domain-containing protein n=1 Tax=Theileria equi strain WA TaxID=1537102 RepID=L0AWK2_THEEQ|nr:hypothetical protein BEWA_028160 [Theileria equi strain WA]AFZ79967.1 hypothetical protein BEWA_028160 [Theileria equi strain WA]|eukprot:XP_004829633.1 hypothetical protein BEWA_028160 [Theileria equi strain WA]